MLAAGEADIEQAGAKRGKQRGVSPSAPGTSTCSTLPETSSRSGDTSSNLNGSDID
jgi:hypothetical protein